MHQTQFAVCPDGLCAPARRAPFPFSFLAPLSLWCLISPLWLLFLLWVWHVKLIWDVLFMLCIKFGCFLRGGSTPHEATRSRRLYNILLWILRRSLQSKLNVFAPAALRICFRGALALLWMFATCVPDQMRVGLCGDWSVACYVLWRAIIWQVEV